MAALFFLPGKIFALVAGIYFYRYLTTPYKLVWLSVICAILSDSFGYLYSHIFKQPNGWIFNFYIIIDVWLLGLAAINFINYTKVKKIFFILLILDTVIWSTSIAVNSIYTFSSLSMVSGCCILAAMYIIVLFNKGLFNNKEILKEPVFWLSIGIILYFGCDIPYMGLQSYLIAHSPATVSKLDYINMILDRIRYPLVAISFILLGRQKQVALSDA